jgi:hypothetical protein
MTDMGQRSAGKGGSLRRAWVSAWIVVLAMGGTTMSFQVYHSVTKGQMPWELAVLYGIVPLLIAMLVLEIVAEWHDSPWTAKAVAYIVMGGSMFLSASATGAVVLYAAPAHFSLLFGALLDAAELLAAYFIMNGPGAADLAAAAIAERQRELAHRTALGAEREAREAAEAALGPLTAGLAEVTARAEDAESGRAELEPERAARIAAEAERDAAVSARETAERERMEALTRSEAIAQKLAAVSGRQARKPTAKTAQRGTRESAQGDDPTAELRALMELRADRDLWRPRMGGELARRIGASPATGRRLHGRYIVDGQLAEPLAERSPEHPDERLDERS